MPADSPDCVNIALVFGALGVEARESAQRQLCRCEGSRCRLVFSFSRATGSKAAGRSCTSTDGSRLAGLSSSAKIRSGLTASHASPILQPRERKERAWRSEERRVGKEWRAWG